MNCSDFWRLFPLLLLLCDWTSPQDASWCHFKLYKFSTLLYWLCTNTLQTPNGAMQLLKEFRMGISNANTFLVKQAPIDWLSLCNFLESECTGFFLLLQYACICICSLYILFLIQLLKLFPCGLLLWPQQFQIRQPPNVQIHYTEPLRGDGDEKI